MATSLQFMPREKLHQLARLGDRLSKRVAAGKETGEKIATVVIHAGEAGATAFALGAVHAKFGGGSGEAVIPGLNVPVDLAVAGGAFVGAFFIGKQHEHLNSVAMGALALYAGRQGMAWAQSAGGQKLLGAPKAVAATPMSNVSPIAAAASR